MAAVHHVAHTMYLRHMASEKSQPEVTKQRCSWKLRFLNPQTPDPVTSEQIESLPGFGGSKVFQGPHCRLP